MTEDRTDINLRLRVVMGNLQDSVNGIEKHVNRILDGSDEMREYSVLKFLKAINHADEILHEWVTTLDDFYERRD